MPITRREFLGGAAMALALARPRLALRRPVSTVFDSDVLAESTIGYRRALESHMPDRDVLVVPAALAIPSASIESYLWRGGMVILESGVAFADPAIFPSHRDALGRTLGIHVQAPVDLWPRRTPPYVDFTWPAPVKVRDFSRIVPLAEQQGHVIATADGLPVALRRTIGAGTLIFLGTPVGPGIWAGDQEARRWLLAVTGATGGPTARTA